MAEFNVERSPFGHAVCFKRIKTNEEYEQGTVDQKLADHMADIDELAIHIESDSRRGAEHDYQIKRLENKVTKLYFWNCALTGAVIATAYLTNKIYKVVEDHKARVARLEEIMEIRREESRKESEL